MKIWDRRKECLIEEEEFGKKKLEFLYHTIPGRILLKGLVSRRFFSEISTRRQRSRKSIKDIAPFVEKYHIDLGDCGQQSFQSFDDFFTRKREYKSDAAKEQLIAIADARMSCYEITQELSLPIKNSVYTVEDLLQKQSHILDQYRGGICLVYRLAVQDYHRYVFLDEGTLEETWEIPGVLHTVRSISEKYKVFSRNYRICSKLKTKHFGEVIQIEVGALTVGKIHNHGWKTNQTISGEQDSQESLQNQHKQHFPKLQEKGYFSYGGSTIIQLYEKDAVRIKEDIIQKNKEGYEVLVRIGDVIGAISQSHVTKMFV